MKDPNFIRNFNMHSYPAIMDMGSQDLFTLFLTTKGLHLIMKHSGVFFFFHPRPLTFFLTILSGYQDFHLKTEILITLDLAFCDTVH